MTGRPSLVSLDLAWFAAIAGLMAGSTVLTDSAQRSDVARFLLDGPPLALAALLAGVSAVRAAQPRLVVGNRVGASKAMLYRGLWLAVIAATLLLLDVLFQQAKGFWSMAAVWLSFVDVPVGDLWVPSLMETLGPVLVQLGAAILLAAPLIAAPRWAVAAGALVAAGVGWWRPHAEWLASALPESREIGLLGELLIGGADAAAVLTVQVLLGVLLGRWLLGARAAARSQLAAGALLAVGAVVAAGAGWAAAHLSGSPSGAAASLTCSTALAASALAALTLLARLLPGAAQRALAPALAAGAAPFTVVLAHALLLATLLAAPEGASWLVLGWVGWIVQLVAALALGALLTALRLPGPVERFLHEQGERFGGLTIARAPMPYLLPDDRSLAWGVRLRAPIAEVWRALTEPALVARWLPDPVMPITRSVMDVRPGGGFLHEHRGTSAPDVTGSYLRVEPPHLLVERMQLLHSGRAAVTAVTVLREDDRSTVLESHERYETPDLRASAIASGMPFATASIHRLASLLEPPDASEIAEADRWVRPAVLPRFPAEE